MGKIARILLLTESFWAFGSGLFLPIFAIFSERVGGSIVDAGIAAAIFLLATSTLQWPIGYLLDKYHHEKWLIAADYFLESLVFVGYIFIDNKWELFVLQALLGIANAIGDPSWESLYDRHTSLKKSGRSWAASHMFPGYLTAFGLIVGTYLISRHGFSLVFLIGSVFSFTAGVISIFLIKNGASDKHINN